MNTPPCLTRLVRRLEVGQALLSPRFLGFVVNANAVALRFADAGGSEFEVDIQRKESGAPYYRAGVALTCSYGPSGAEVQCQPAIDKVCDYIFADESEYLPLFDLDSGAQAPAATLGAIDREVPAQLSSVFSAVALDDLVLKARTDGSAMELGARRNGQEANIAIAFRGGQHNPYAAGARIDILIDGTAVDPPAHDLFTQLIAAVLAHEEDVFEVLVNLNGPAPRDRQGRSLLAVGRLSPIASHRAPSFDEPLPSAKPAVLYLTSPCFANCIFCGEHTTRNYSYCDVDSVLADIRAHHAQTQKVLIVGYEPLSHPGVPEMIGACRSAGVRDVELMTTGIPLGNSALVEALLTAGLTSIAVPLYSHVAATNDRIMRKAGAFEKTVRGLDMIARSSCAIHVHSLLLQQNLPDIDSLFDLVTSRWNATFVAAPIRVKSNFEQTAPSYAEIVRLVQRAPVLSVPFCLYTRMRHHQDLDMKPQLHDSLAHMADSMRIYLSQDLKQMEPCSRCVYQRACLGIIPEQLKLEPSLRLVPFTSP